MTRNTYNLPRHLREPATLIRCKLIISLRFGTKENQKNLRPKNQRGGEVQIRTVGSHSGGCEQNYNTGNAAVPSQNFIRSRNLWFVTDPNAGPKQDRDLNSLLGR